MRPHQSPLTFRVVRPQTRRILVLLRCRVVPTNRLIEATEVDHRFGRPRIKLARQPELVLAVIDVELRLVSGRSVPPEEPISRVPVGDESD